MFNTIAISEPQRCSEKVRNWLLDTSQYYPPAPAVGRKLECRCLNSGKEIKNYRLTIGRKIKLRDKERIGEHRNGRVIGGYEADDERE